MASVFTAWSAEWDQQPGKAAILYNTLCMVWTDWVGLSPRPSWARFLFCLTEWTMGERSPTVERHWRTDCNARTPGLLEWASERFEPRQFEFIATRLFVKKFPWQPTEFVVSLTKAGRRCHSLFLPFGLLLSTRWLNSPRTTTLFFFPFVFGWWLG